MFNKTVNLSEEEIYKIKTYPKIELHCHLDGSLPKDLIRTLAQEQNIDVPESEEEFEKLIIITENCKELMDCFKLFDFSLKLLQTVPAIKTSVFGLMQEAAKDGQNKEKNNQKWKVESFYVHQVICQVTAQPFQKKGVVGVDLARVFAEHMNHVETFKVAKELGFNITIHAGEFPPAQTVLDCIKNLNADRIGHGVYAALDPSIIQVLCDKNIPLEICVTSNIDSGRFTYGFQKYEDHFVRKLFEEGVKVTINCDNRTISNTTLTKEFCLLKEIFKFERHEFKALYLNAVNASFANEEVKKYLREFQKQFD